MGGDRLILPNISLIDEASEMSEEDSGVRFNPLPPYDPFNGHEYVDLGLPSGLKWANCNVGAEKESDYGLYFSWGETVGYSDSDVRNGIHGFYPGDYKFNDGEWQCDGSSYTKYIPSDGLTTLLSEDDTATVNMGGSWRMPSKEEYEELLNNTTHTWTTVEGVYGRLFTGNNGNTLFFPSAGNCRFGNVKDVGSDGYYWSSSLKSSIPILAYSLEFDSYTCFSGDYDRFGGLAVRGVMD